MDDSSGFFWRQANRHKTSRVFLRLQAHTKNRWAQTGSLKAKTAKWLSGKS